MLSNSNYFLTGLLLLAQRDVHEHSHPLADQLESGHGVPATSL